MSARSPAHSQAGPSDAGAALADARAWEPALHAWAHLDDAPPPPGRGPLAGVPFAVKDVIDVAGMPTRFGSDAFADAPAAPRDATVVSALRDAGAVPIGKTRTTEFAFIDPTITENPYAAGHSPGGSSSGSGAVVGARIVPFSLGTQTAGSLCRPAAYCGAYSYKPGLGALPTVGMAPLSPSFDAVGVIAESADWLAEVFGVLAAAFGIADAPAPAGSLRIGFLSSPEHAPEESMRACMGEVCRRLGAAGHSIQPMTSGVRFSDIIERHRTIMLAEAARALSPRLQGKADALQPKFRAAMDEGAAITDKALAPAREFIADTRARFWDEVAGVDLLLAYPVPAAAPGSLENTGDQSYLTPWTAFGGPLVTVPAGLDESGLPLGVLFAMPPGRDAALVRTACRLSSLMPETPAPAGPASR